MNPDGGLRIDNDVDQIAAFEFGANARVGGGTAAAARRPGWNDRTRGDAAMQPILLPFSYHPTMLSGPNAAYGVASAGDRVLQVGDPVCAGLGYWGGNTARAGFLGRRGQPASRRCRRLRAEDCRALLRDGRRLVRDDPHRTDRRRALRRHVQPDRRSVLRRLPQPRPLHSPRRMAVVAGRPASPVVFTSGNAMQFDIIPITGSAYHTAQIEDGVVLADADVAAADRGALPRRVERGSSNGAR